MLTRLSVRIDDAARDLAARINGKVIVCTDAEQTTDLRALTCIMLGWAAEIDALEQNALAQDRAVRNGRVPRPAPWRTE